MRQRTSYPKPFKAQVVQECLQPGGVFTRDFRGPEQKESVENIISECQFRGSDEDVRLVIRHTASAHLRSIS